MYEKSFSAISERYFKASPWPAVEAVAKYADDDHVFCLLYKEMYFRHVYGKVTPTLEQRWRAGTTTPTCSTSSSTATSTCSSPTSGCGR